MKVLPDSKSFIAVRQFLGRRSEQQDRFAVAPFASERGEEGILVIVADGHAADGDRAAEGSVAQIDERMRMLGDRQPETFRLAFLAAHELLLRNGIIGGATATCVTVHCDRIVTAWVGNSQARLATSDGKLKTLAIPHEYGIHRAETARLDAMGATIEGPDAVWARGCYDARRQVERPKRGRVCTPNASLEVTRAIGDREFDPFVLHEPEVRSRAPAIEDRWLVVATDGLWHAARRTGKRRRIGELLARCGTAETVAAELETLLKTWRLDDNTTFVVVDLACIA